ncbi:MAG: hypothetical protein A3F78_07210 [Burkholderiales bacterium RIFCSPLOWO2_12_FULL_61_40]|nr:MAG: hypothetical protein A3F78_07210 [Burkholderiales bacterium RIFCSPLOWO2_12_FULL_61_40]
MNKISSFLQSPANWGGLGLSTVALVLSSLGLAQWGGGALALLGYAAGFGVAGMWFGFPQLTGNRWDALEFEDQGDTRTSMLTALNAVRQLVDDNPQGRLPAELQSKVLNLCQQLAQLLDQWERSKGQLSLEESFHARHIALRYLPDALKTYLSIPQQFAMAKRLANGRTAQDTFAATLDDLNAKVTQLSEDLATQDAQAFLNHSQFLQEKFKPPRLG